MKTVDRMSTMSGTISVIDPQSRLLTIEGLVMNKTFEIAQDAEVVCASKPRAALTDLKKGDAVEVTYEQHEAMAIAHAVHDLGAHEQRKAA